MSHLVSPCFANFPGGGAGVWCLCCLGCVCLVWLFSCFQGISAVISVISSKFQLLTDNVSYSPGNAGKKIEFENGIPKHVFDSLQGKQRLTTELAKKLRVFGVLFNVGNEHVPFLRTRYLDEAAGIVPAISRGRNAIVVLGRGRIQWARNALCKKYKAPTSKKGRVRKHALKGFKTKPSKWKAKWSQVNQRTAG